MRSAHFRREKAVFAAVLADHEEPRHPHDHQQGAEDVTETRECPVEAAVGAIGTARDHQTLWQRHKTERQCSRTTQGIGTRGYGDFETLRRVPAAQATVQMTTPAFASTRNAEEVFDGD